jgi:hypothetical protein
MTLKKYRIFDIKSSYMFWLLDLIALAAVSYAIYYNYFVLTAGLGAGLPILLTIVLGFLSITAAYHIVRYAFKKTIDGQTNQGLFVILDSNVKTEASKWLWTNSQGTAIKAVVDNIDKEVEFAMKFWLNWYDGSDGIEYRVNNKIAAIMPPTKAGDKVQDTFNGGFIVVEDEPFIQQSSKGPMAWATGKLMGMQDGNQMAVAWNPGINPGITGLLSIVRHEAGHAALTALNIPDGDNGVLHHKLFETVNYGA